VVRCVSNFTRGNRRVYRGRGPAATQAIFVPAAHCAPRAVCPMAHLR